MHHPPQQNMYFGDLFAEIEANANDEPIPTQPPSSTTCAPTTNSTAVLPFELAMLGGNNTTTTGGAAAAGGEEQQVVPTEHNSTIPQTTTATTATSNMELQPESLPPQPQPPQPPQLQQQALHPEASGKRRKQELHRRHSKRYRDNLGELFSELEQILPQVVPDCKLKTKSQIIATSVSAVKQLKSEVSTLEMRYVMSSPSNRARWVEDTVSNATVIQDAIEPFMRLLLGLQNWKHAELWMRIGEPCIDNPFSLRLERVTSATDPSRTKHAHRFLEFVKGSQLISFEAGDDSLVGRIATSLSPEWLDLTSEHALSGFKRGQLALSCGLCVCFAVPFLVRGHVVAVVLFYDNTPRADVLARVSVAQDLASAIGNCYGALHAKKTAAANGAAT